MSTWATHVYQYRKYTSTWMFKYLVNHGSHVTEVKETTGPHGKNIFVRYMSKCIKYIFAKICIYKKYILHIFSSQKWDIFANIYLTYIWRILDIYFYDAKIYFRGQKTYMSHIYFISIERGREMPHMTRM